MRGFLKSHSFKPFVAVAVGLIILRELWDGSFQQLKVALKRISLKPFRGLLMAFITLTLFTLLLDPFLITFLQGMNSPLAQTIANYGQKLGRNINPWIGLTGIYFLACLTKRRIWRKGAFGLILSSLATSVVSHLMKFIFLRARPDSHLGPFSFFNLQGLIHDERAFQSFPSGDVAVVAGATSCLFFMIPNRYLRWLVFLLPLSTAFARVSLNRHWPSDTVASLMVSLLLGKFIAESLQKQEAFSS